MTVKRFEMGKEYSLDINIIPVEEADGSFVHYDDYAALAEQVRLLTEQRDAVVAENAALDKLRVEHQLDGIDNLRSEKFSEWPDEYLNEIDEFAQTLRDRIHESGTSTDAAIASLRAEGAEMFAVNLTHLVDLTDSDMQYARRALEFARQLRESKGANHE